MGNSAVISIETGELLSSAGIQAPATLLSMDAGTNSGESHLADLLQAVASKDRSAFAAFYDATTDRVLSLALRITQKMEIAEEVVGDVFLQVWRQADRFDSARGNAFAWLTMLCRSRALDAVRKSGATPTYGALSIDEVPEPQSTDIPQDMLVAVDQNSALHAALEELTPDQRQLLALAYFRGYSHSELSQFTGLPLGTVKTQIRSAVSKLRELMIAPDTPERISA